MFNQRASGVLAHPTSFPSAYGMGDLGAGAYDFIAFLAKAKQTLWQVLPLGPTGFGDSPYQSFSTFAGNALLISPGELVKAGWLTGSEAESPPHFDAHSVDYGAVIEYKMKLFRKAYARFRAEINNTKHTAAQAAGAKNGSAPDAAPFSRFCKKNASWLDDYALFAAIKTHLIEARRNEFKPPALAEYAKKMKKLLTADQINDYYYGAAWNSWPKELAERSKPALKKIADELADEIGFVKFLQFEFARQWSAVKKCANDHGIRIIGDIPIFVAYDSADVWAQPDLYLLKGDWPSAVAGVPPDYFSETGQLWGNPLYDWKAHKAQNYAWWCARARSVLELVDIVRIDHFRGFEAYWSVPAGEKTAVKGKWVKAPGNDFFKVLASELKSSASKQSGALPIIAEDLGVITSEVDKLRTDFALPGMKVLQFAMNPSDASAYLSHLFTSDQTVVYTGTHDNDTTAGWYASATETERDYFRRYMNVSGDEPAWDMIRLALSSSGVFAVVPVQDVLGLGTHARMNQPGIASGWWKFRFAHDALTDTHAQKLAYLTELYHRGV
jgi:4-alpha-glucanotransferase